MNKILSRRAFLKSAALGRGGHSFGRLPAQGRRSRRKLVTEKEVVKETVVVEGAAKEVTKVVEKEKLVNAVTAPRGGPVEIVTFDRNIPQDIDFRKELAKRFMEKNPNITVKIEVMPDDYMASLLARIASGNAGDCFRYGTHYGLANLALRGIFYELDEFAAKDKLRPGGLLQGGHRRLQGGGQALRPAGERPPWVVLRLLHAGALPGGWRGRAHGQVDLRRHDRRRGQDHQEARAASPTSTACGWPPTTRPR